MKKLGLSFENRRASEVYEQRSDLTALSFVLTDVYAASKRSLEK